MVGADDSKTRLFVAVEVPTDVRDGIDLAVDPLRRARPELRWVEPSAYHLTMAFVGWCDDAGVRTVQAACAEAAGAVGPFRLGLTGAADTFGGSVLWVGVAASEQLGVLAAAVRRALAARGTEVEARPFHAHVTIARAGRGTRVNRRLAQQYEGPASAWTVERLVLMRSRLRRGGAQYGVEAAWRLSDAAAASHS